MTAALASVLAEAEFLRDLAGLNAELTALAVRLSERTIELCDLQDRLRLFEARYLAAVADRIDLLDTLIVRWAESVARRRPEDARARERLRRAHRRQRRHRRPAPTGRPETPASPTGATAEARALYRRIAMQVHPDRVTDARRRQVAGPLMCELNEAYAQGDLERMRAVEEAWQEAPADDDRQLQRDRMVSGIARIRSQLAHVEEELAVLVASELHQLMELVEAGEAEGGDPLAELAADLDRQIKAVRRRLAEERA